MIIIVFHCIIIRDNKTNNNTTDWEDEPDWIQRNTPKEVDLCSLWVNLLGTTHLYGISNDLWRRMWGLLAHKFPSPWSFISYYTLHLARNTSMCQANWVLLVSFVFVTATADTNLAKLPLLVLATSYPRTTNFECVLVSFSISLWVWNLNMRARSQLAPVLWGAASTCKKRISTKLVQVCLGILHASRALTKLVSCVHCHLLCGPTLERWVKFMEKVLGKVTVAQQDPLISLLKDLSLYIQKRGACGWT